MNPVDCCRTIAALKEQIERDSALDPSQFEQRLEQAILSLHQIGRSDRFSARASVQLSHVERSIREFYRPTSSRGWAQRFALNDLKLLEELCTLPPGCDGKEPRFAA